MFIPLSDDAPHARERPPHVTYGIIAANIVVFLMMLTLAPGEQQAFALTWGVVPGVVTGLFPSDAMHRVAPFLTYMFLHGGWSHIIFNMLFLWIFGDDVEDAMGPGKFALFYGLCGVAGAMVYVFFAASPGAPLVGASGAIAGVMAAYMMIRPCARVKVLFLIIILNIRAIWLIAVWALTQVTNVLEPTAINATTAWWAHIGGFLAGAALVAPFKKPGVRLFQCRKTYAGPWGSARA
ncbi:MAG: rhomboid family intramembrane serine protease [Hyphomicrobiales bacterium]|nr:rhomboid family intramembrane serine protease [Hyphomicrobiales bacterium]